MRFLRRKTKGYPVIDLNDRRQRRRVIAFFIGGALVLLLFPLIGFRAATYMDSPEFCGELCHTVMRPELVAYQNSPHARVDCVNCHIGLGADWLVRSKISGTRQVLAVLTKTYSTPIESPVKELRPARETCERCHWPQKFTEDRIRVYRTYDVNEANTERLRVQAFRVGGGRGDSVAGIHWHIAANVWYLALDEKRQDIAWVGVEKADGKFMEYVNTAKAGEITPEHIEKEKRLMDCIDCHNRATHVFRSPEEMVDEAMALGLIDPSLPFIKKMAMETLSSLNPSTADANNKAETIPEFYKDSYPQVYEEQKKAVDGAVTELKDIAASVSFPEMKVDWTTYPSNLGHTKSPGCFRCHGKLVNLAAGGKVTVIRAGCDLCHYSIPESIIRASKSSVALEKLLQTGTTVGISALLNAAISE